MFHHSRMKRVRPNNIERKKDFLPASKCNNDTPIYRNYDIKCLRYLGFDHVAS
jgi:hypothetical protein